MDDIYCGEALEALRKEAEPLLGAALTPVQLGCMALAISALKSRRDLEQLLAGTRRSAQEGNLPDMCFRILRLVYAALSGEGPTARMREIDAEYEKMRGKWLEGRPCSFVLTSEVEDYPPFFRKRLGRTGLLTTEGDV